MILRARHVGVGFSEDIHNCDVALQCYVAAKCKMQYIQSTKKIHFRNTILKRLDLVSTYVIVMWPCQVAVRCNIKC